MKFRRYLAILPILLLLAAMFFRATSSNVFWVNLAPVPYEMKVPKDIAERVTVQNQPVDAAKSGAIAVVTLSYQPVKGEKTWFMTAYYFVEEELDETINPNEVPPYGFKLFGREGMALSVIGPQEAIFEPLSEDGKNTSALYEILYDPKSYRTTG
jgi:hypothetical protein